MASRSRYICCFLCDMPANTTFLKHSFFIFFIFLLHLEIISHKSFAQEKEPFLPLFSAEEIANLDQLRADLKRAEKSIHIVPKWPEYPTYSIFLDSTYQGIKSYSYSTGSWEATQLNLPNIQHFGIPGNNYSGKSLNQQLVYAVDSSGCFKIYNSAGSKLFDLPLADTLENGTVRHYHACFYFLDVKKSLGCFVVHRGDGDPKTLYCSGFSGNTEYRIYALDGKPLTSWKKRLFEGKIDPYFRAYIQTKNNLDKPAWQDVQFIALTGELLFEQTQCTLAKAAPAAIYEVKAHQEERSYLINFQLKTIELVPSTIYSRAVFQLKNSQ